MKRKAPKQERDAQGRRLCRLCKAIVPKGRISYCSAKCADAFAEAYFPQVTRHKVFRRDRGVCQICGCDTEKLRRILRFVDRWDRSKVARAMGFNGAWESGHFWQADHITECVRGGWGMGLENFRTACTPCHKAETARLAAELAAERRQAKEKPDATPELFVAENAATADGGEFWSQYG